MFINSMGWGLANMEKSNFGNCLGESVKMVLTTPRGGGVGGQTISMHLTKLLASHPPNN